MAAECGRDEPTLSRRRLSIPVTPGGSAENHRDYCGKDQSDAQQVGSIHGQFVDAHRLEHRQGLAAGSVPVRKVAGNIRPHIACDLVAGVQLERTVEPYERFSEAVQAVVGQRKVQGGPRILAKVVQ